MEQCLVFGLKCLPDILYIRRTPIFLFETNNLVKINPKLEKKDNLCDAIKIYGVKSCFPLKNVCQT